MNTVAGIAQGACGNVYAVGGPQAVPFAVRVQDYVRDNGLSIFICRHCLAEAFQLIVLSVLSDAGAHHPLARLAGALHSLGQEVD